jgi:hypothetical protein
MMNYALIELLTQLIDYAGLFPPATLEMATAVRNYAAYRKSEQVRWLGRFVVPATRLDEFGRAAAAVIEPSDAWPLSALISANADWQKVASFNESGRNARIESVELKANSAAEIAQALQSLPDQLTAFFEIPSAADPTELINTLAAADACAKVRTGGVTAEAFPSPRELARFIAACTQAEVPFKATAGLHHPLRGEYRLTYEPDSPTATMYGFLNVFLAAAFAQNGMDEAQLVEVLEERSPKAFVFESGRVVWRGEQLVRAHLTNARHLLALSFGSCSFAEPVEELQQMGLL